MSKPATPTFDLLSEDRRMFVEALLSGYTGVEAAKLAGSKANSRRALAVTASRWKAESGVQKAIAELREQFEVDEDGLIAMARNTLRELMKDKSSPSARARACELALKLGGKLGAEPHLHLHASSEAAPIAPEEEKRLLDIAVRNTKFCCPHCSRTFLGAEATEVIEP